MPPSKRKPAQADSAPAEQPAERPVEQPEAQANVRPAGLVDRDGSVYRYEQLIHAPSGSKVVPGPDTAAVMAAINAGWRPTGEARIERTEDRLNGRATLVVWAVPVEAA